MATPANPLDKYVTYTYHFELHAAAVDAQLDSQEGMASELSTTRFLPNGTLLINTRKDAHQVIDNVRFETMDPATTKTDVPAGYGTMTLDVIEPGSFAFIEKCNEIMQQQNVTSLSNLVFGLKIIFVGRLPNNAIVIETLPIVRMILVDMNASFNQQGGEYQLYFSPTATLATDRSSYSSKLGYAYVNKAITFEASTIEQALKELESRINDIYINEQKYIDPGELRQIRCKITFDPEISGHVVGMQSDSFIPVEKRKFSFKPNNPIGSFIMDIVKHCPVVLDKISAAKPSITTRFNEGAFFPVVVPSVEYGSKEILIKFHLKVYKGGAREISGPFEFEYYFADAGKNVDVLGYDIKFNNITALLTTNSTRGQDKHTNLSGTVTDPKMLKNTLVENVTQTGIEEQVERNKAPGKSNDIVMLSAQTRRDEIGYNSYPANSVPGVRKAIDSIVAFNGSFNLTSTFDIRGHKTILEACIPGGDGIKTLTSGDALWIKVNVYMPEDGNIGQFMTRRKFFYDGYYRVISVLNVFQAGKFMQTITMIANELPFSQGAALTETMNPRDRR